MEKFNGYVSSEDKQKNEETMGFYASSDQRIDEAVIVPYDCEECFDTGIISGTADLDGERILIAKICDCIKKKLEETNDCIRIRD